MLRHGIELEIHIYIYMSLDLAYFLCANLLDLPKFNQFVTSSGGAGKYLQTYAASFSPDDFLGE